MLLFCAFLVSLCVLSYYIYVWPRTGEPPLFPGYLPLIGHVHHFLGDTAGVWEYFKKSVACCLASPTQATTFLLGPIKMYAITDPEDCNKVIATCLRKDLLSYKMSKPFLGDGLVFAPIETWTKHRKLLNPTFSQHVLNGYMSVFNTQARRLVKALETQDGKPPFDFKDYLHPNAVQTICLTAMGIDIGQGDDVKKYIASFQSLLHSAMMRGMKPWLHYDFVYNMTNMKKMQDELSTIFRSMSAKVLDKKKKQIKLNETIEQPTKISTSEYIKSKPVIDLLLDLENGVLTDQEIRDEIDTILMTGSDTYVTVLIFVLVQLGSHPKVQEKVYAELQEVFESSKRDVEIHDLPRLVYLEAAIKESMRYYSLTPMLLRKIDKDIRLKHHTLRSGNGCMVLVYGAHRHHVWGPDADQFKPERWLNPANLPDISKTYFAFSQGRRNCLGKKYAMMIMKTVLTHILREFHITGDYTKVKLRMDFMLKLDSGCEMSIQRRNKY